MVEVRSSRPANGQGSRDPQRISFGAQYPSLECYVCRVSPSQGHGRGGDAGVARHVRGAEDGLEGREEATDGYQNSCDDNIDRYKSSKG